MLKEDIKKKKSEDSMKMLLVLPWKYFSEKT
jgi:hypothetical protein